MDRNYNAFTNAPVTHPPSNVTAPLIPPQLYHPVPTYVVGHQGHPNSQANDIQGLLPHYQIAEVEPVFLQQATHITTGWVWCLATLSMLCCPLTGIIALISAAIGYVNEKKQKPQSAKTCVKISKIMSGLSLTIGPFLYLASIVVLFFFLVIKYLL